MAPRNLASAVLATFALVGCGQQQSPTGSGSPGPLNCTTSNCKVAVTVTGDCANAANIKVTPDTLPVPKNNHDLKIDWDIQTAGFKWVPAPKIGITFTTPPIPPDGEFKNPHDNGNKYDLTDTNSQTVPTPYKYDIHLQKDDGTLCAVKDPTIVNGS
jgi:hypothetical protein